MDGRQLLIHLLQEMRQDETSGHIYYIVQGGRDGKIIVDQGIINSVTYRGVPIGAAELGVLEVSKVVVVASTSATSTAPTPSTPDMAAVLAALETAGASAQDTSGAPQGEAPAQPTVDLVSEVLTLLDSLYGDRAAQRVTKIATQFPPADQPQAFLGKCQELAALTLGPQAAHTMFQPLYEKVNGQ